MRLRQSPISGGISPANELFPRLRIAREEKVPIQEGIGPERRLLEREIQLREEQFFRLAGRAPERSLSSRIKFCRFFRRPISSGISPESWFCHMMRSRRLVKDLMEVGIGPLRKL